MFIFAKEYFRAGGPGGIVRSLQKGIRDMDLFKISARAGEAAPLAPKSAKALAAAVRNLAGWDRAYSGSAVSFQGAWIVAGRRGLGRGIAVGWPAGKRPRWTGPPKGSGADADHLKPLDDVARCADAGFVSFTLDAIEKVIDAAPRMNDAALEQAYRKILAEVPAAKGWERKYSGKTFTFEKKVAVRMEGRAFREAIVKYGRAIPYWLEMEKRVRQKTRGRACEIEIAVDETGAVTTSAEHLFIVRELNERGMTCEGFAPRFVGEFEKGVDYKGERKMLEDSVVEHAVLARAHGGYKISVHSGSDKFSIYPMIAKAPQGRFPLKTAGTSWMEAVRVIARKD